MPELHCPDDAGGGRSLPRKTPHSLSCLCPHAGSKFKGIRIVDTAIMKTGHSVS